MNKLYDLVYRSGPHGDECTTYDIKFNTENITLQDFIKNVLDNKPEEWGEFCVYYKDDELKKLPYLGESEKYSKVSILYKYGKLRGPNNHPELLDKYIDINNTNWANGGWSFMDYWIKLKD